MAGSTVGISYTGVNTALCAVPSSSLAFRGVETGEDALAVKYSAAERVWAFCSVDGNQYF